MFSTADFRKGLKIEWEGTPYIITDFQHVKPGKGGAFVRTKIKNLINGRVIDQTFRSGEKVHRPDMQEKPPQYPQGVRRRVSWSNRTGLRCLKQAR